MRTIDSQRYGESPTVTRSNVPHKTLFAAVLAVAEQKRPKATAQKAGLIPKRKNCVYCCFRKSRTSVCLHDLHRISRRRTERIPAKESLCFGDAASKPILWKADYAKFGGTAWRAEIRGVAAAVQHPCALGNGNGAGCIRAARAWNCIVLR